MCTLKANKRRRSPKRGFYEIANPRQCIRYDLEQAKKSVELFLAEQPAGMELASIHSNMKGKCERKTLSLSGGFKSFPNRRQRITRCKS